MRVAKHDRINALWVEGKVQISLVGVTTPPLKNSTLQQDSFIVYFNQMHRACYFLGGTEKAYIHMVTGSG